MTETDDAWAAHVRQVVSTLRPEDFQPWNDVPPGDGRMLSEAILAFAPDVLRRQVSMHLAMKDAFIESRVASQNLFASCWSLLRGRLRRKELLAKGWRRGASATGIIPAEFFDAATPDFDANSLEARHDAYYDIRVAEADHPSLGADTSPGFAGVEKAQVGAPDCEPANGPEPRHGDEFIQEMIRLALKPDGFETRKELEAHMKQWCANTSGDKAPSDRSIERWVKRYCPPELPTK